MFRVGYLLFVISMVRAIPVQNDENSIDDPDVIDLSQYGTKMYGLPSEKTGDLIDHINATELNPEELGSYLEGDILIPHGAPRNGIVGEHYRWPNGIVPYFISNSFQESTRLLIERKCIQQYLDKTCLKFIPKRPSDQNYISIENGHSGCWSNIGMSGGKQTLNLQEGGCTTLIGTCLHEILHALGFLHEQNRFDRDPFVKINYNNIKNGYEANFQKGRSSEQDSQGISYDYGSVMHYNVNAFSKNTEPTIIALKQTNKKIGQREGFSKNDLKKVNRMYCKGLTSEINKGGSGGSKPSNGFVSGILGLIGPNSMNLDADEINGV